jgi:hypothetical protein
MFALGGFNLFHRDVLVVHFAFLPYFLTFCEAEDEPVFIFGKFPEFDRARKSPARAVEQMLPKARDWQVSLLPPNSLTLARSQGHRLARESTGITQAGQTAGRPVKRRPVLEGR